MVVSFLFSTSNHNSAATKEELSIVVSFLFSTSNHNHQTAQESNIRLYLSYFLHQTTTYSCLWNRANSCIFPIFYIKPQPILMTSILFKSCIFPIFYIKPQLNYLLVKSENRCIFPIFYIKPQPPDNFSDFAVVVSFLFSTSNHNCEYQ